MSRIENGDPLTTPLAQPGFTAVEDGYGLITIRGRYYMNYNTAGFNLGDTETITAARVSKITETFEKNGLKIQDLELVKLDATTTRPNITGSSGLTSEHITTHPEFFTASTGIAGAKPFTASALVKSVGQTLYKGLNGAHFSDPDGGRFEGFLDPTYPLYYGKSHYLAPVTSFSGVIYTSNDANVTTLRNAVGKTSGTNAFGGITLLPSYVGTSFTTSGRNQLLLSQVNFEDYAVTSGGTAYIFKINYEIRYNREGYVSPVYASA